MSEDQKVELDNNISSRLLQHIGNDWSNWMTNLPHELRSTPINYLTIPGSHDSLTANLDPKSRVGPDEPTWMRLLGNHGCGRIFKRFMYRWSVTQEARLAEQLKAGIRYFDLRLATRKNYEGVFIIHGLYGENIIDVLDGFMLFLKTHPKELIILDFQHLYRFTTETHDFVIQQINMICGTKLLPSVSDVRQVTLDYASENGYQVIAIYRNIAAATEPKLWPSSSFPNPWPNTLSTSWMFEFLEKNMNDRKITRAYISQCVLTPDASFVVKHLTGNLKRNIAIPCSRDIITWLGKQNSGPNGPNIVIADFISMEDFNFVEAVVKLNETLC